MSLNECVDAIEYIIKMPKHLCVNELSIDPVQKQWPTEE
jgi:hypothetical protein